MDGGNDSPQWNSRCIDDDRLGAGNCPRYVHLRSCLRCKKEKSPWPHGSSEHSVIALTGTQTSDDGDIKRGY